MDMQEGEIYRIQKEAERLKEKARELMLPELFTRLYHTKICYYPRWISDEQRRKSVCSLITNATQSTEQTEHGEKIDKIKITLKDKEYTFTFRKYNFDTPDGEMHTNGELKLYYNDKKILTMTMGFYYQNFDTYDSSLINGWHFPSDVNSFVDGDWVSDFRELARKIRAEDEERNQQEERLNDVRQAKKLKEDFGIE